MKRVLALLILWLCMPAGAWAVPEDLMQAFEKGNAAYQEADFNTAVQEYESILEGGFTAPEIEYNIGNAYLKGGSVGRAILHYRRALTMDPSLEDAERNLDFARRRTRDVQQSSSAGISWLTRFGLTTGKAVWMLLAAVVLWCLVGAARIFWWPNHFMGNIVSGAFSGLVLLSLVGLLYQVSMNRSVHEGVVLAEEIEVRSGPGQEFTVHFRLHEGSEVELIRESVGWQEVRVSAELQGWIPVSSVAAI